MLELAPLYTRSLSMASLLLFCYINVFKREGLRWHFGEFLCRNIGVFLEIERKRSKGDWRERSKQCENEMNFFFFFVFLDCVRCERK